MYGPVRTVVWGDGKGDLPSHPIDRGYFFRYQGVSCRRQDACPTAADDPKETLRASS